MRRVLTLTLLVAAATASGLSYGQQKKFDPYTDGAKAGKADPYTDGAKTGKFEPYTDGAKQSTQVDLNATQGKPDPSTAGAKAGTADP